MSYKTDHGDFLDMQIKFINMGIDHDTIEKIINRRVKEEQEAEDEFLRRKKINNKINLFTQMREEIIEEYNFLQDTIQSYSDRNSNAYRSLVLARKNLTDELKKLNQEIDLLERRLE